MGREICTFKTGLKKCSRQTVLGQTALLSTKTPSVQGTRKKYVFLLSRSQAGPGRTVQQEQEEIYRNHVQTFIYLSAVRWVYLPPGPDSQDAGSRNPGQTILRYPS